MNSFLQPPVIEDRNGATQYDSQTSQSISRSFNQSPPSFQLISKREILADCNQSNVMHCAKKTKFNSSTSISKPAVVHASEDISNTESISTKECNSSTSISKPVAVHASEEISNTVTVTSNTCVPPADWPKANDTLGRDLVEKGHVMSIRMDLTIDDEEMKKFVFETSTFVAVLKDGRYVMDFSSAYGNETISLYSTY